MKDDVISRQQAIDALECVGYDFSESGLSVPELEEVWEAFGEVEQDMIKRIRHLPSAQPEQLEVMSDGTLHITVDMDISKIDRILLSQKGTHYGNLFYVDDDEPERKTGKWIIISEFEDCYYAKCNQCNTIQVFYYNKSLTNFCPDCGADMRGIKDGCSNIKSKDKI